MIYATTWHKATDDENFQPKWIIRSSGGNVDITIEVQQDLYCDAYDVKEALSFYLLGRNFTRHEIKEILEAIPKLRIPE